MNPFLNNNPSTNRESSYYREFDTPETQETTNVSVSSEQASDFWMSVYLNLSTFEDMVKLVHNNQISIGTLFTPEVLRLLATEMSNNTLLRKEVAKATDYISVNSYFKLGNARAIIDMILKVTPVFRVLHPKMKMNDGSYSSASLIDEDLEDYTYISEANLHELILSNIWLVSFYVIAYVVEFIAGGKIHEVMNHSTQNKHAI